MPILFAHGLAATYEDLPLPLTVFYIGALAALVASFVLLAVLWKTPRWSDVSGTSLSGEPEPRMAPGPLRRLRPTRAWHLIAGGGALLWLALTISVGLFGPSAATANAASNLVFVWGWVLVVPAAIVLGSAVLSMHPWWALARAGGLPATTSSQWRTAVGVWPAWFALLAFTWLELVYPTASRVQTLTTAVLLFTVATIIAMSRFGATTWRDNGDGFGVYMRLLASMSPWVRRSDGSLGMRWPFVGALRDVRPQAGLVAVTTLLIGSVSFDGLSRTGWWVARVNSATADLSASGISTENARLIFSSFGFVMLLVIAWLAFEAAAFVAAKVGRLDTSKARSAQLFAPTLLPIALAYVVAHYFSFAFQVQDLARTLTDPFGTGLHIFGEVNSADYVYPSGGTVWLVQAGAIVVGHVAGLVLAHDRALDVAPRHDNGAVNHRAAIASQIPMLLLMLLYTVGGLYFLSEGLS